MPILNAATYYYYLCVCVCLCVCVPVCCATMSELASTVIKGNACHSCVSRGQGDQAPHRREKEKAEGGAEMVRRPANEGQRGSGESVRAPFVLLCRSSKDKLAATATLGLPLNSCTHSVHGGFVCQRRKGWENRALSLCCRFLSFVRAVTLSV